MVMSATSTTHGAVRGRIAKWAKYTDLVIGGHPLGLDLLAHFETEVA
jgi:hypothetical protein